MVPEIDLNDYESNSGETSYYRSIPIEFLDITRKILKSKGLNYKIRYRGPRNKSIDTRSRFNRQSSCLKGNATTFTVYGVN